MTIIKKIANGIAQTKFASKAINERADLSDRRSALKLTATYKDPAPSIVFLLPTDTSMNALRTVREADGQSLGILPLLGVSKPGRIIFEVSFADGRKENIAKEIKPDFINILIF